MVWRCPHWARSNAAGAEHPNWAQRSSGRGQRSPNPYWRPSAPRSRCSGRRNGIHSKRPLLVFPRSSVVTERSRATSPPTILSQSGCRGLCRLPLRCRPTGSELRPTTPTCRRPCRGTPRRCERRSSDQCRTFRSCRPRLPSIRRWPCAARCGPCQGTPRHSPREAPSRGEGCFAHRASRAPGPQDRGTALPRRRRSGPAPEQGASIPGVLVDVCQESPNRLDLVEWASDDAGVGADINLGIATFVCAFVHETQGDGLRSRRSADSTTPHGLQFGKVEPLHVSATTSGALAR